MIRVSRAILQLLVALFALLGAMSSPVSADDLATSPEVAVYTYDALQCAAPINYAASERGPPTIHATTSSDEAVDRRSRGASLRLKTVTPLDVTTYDDSTQLAPRGGAGTTTREQVRRAGRNPSTLTGGGVAAKNGDDLTRVGRWMGDDELAKMQKTGLVQEGSGGRTFVTNPADPAAFPAGKGVFAEFNVPTNSLFPAGKPEWSVIPGPNVTTRLFGTPPSQMPPSTCIVVVCRR